MKVENVLGERNFYPVSLHSLSVEPMQLGHSVETVGHPHCVADCNSNISVPAQCAPHTADIPFSLKSTLSLPVGRPYLYLLPIQDRTRIKIGRSIDPLDRIAGFQNIYPEIDLTRAVIIAVDSHRIETVLHTIFESRRQKLSSRRDGYTEWFNGDFIDEVIELCQHVAYYRGVDYQIIPNVETHLQEYRQRNPLAGLRQPRLTRAQSQARQIEIRRQMADLAIESALQFIEVLMEKDFDGLVRHGDRYYLVRTVLRQDEPEYWNDDATTLISAWDQRLLRAAEVSIRVDGGSCCFRFTKTPTFNPLGDQHGIETYQLTQGPVEIEQPDTVSSLPDAEAFKIVWEHLLNLDMLESSEPDQRGCK